MPVLLVPDHLLKDLNTAIDDNVKRLFKIWVLQDGVASGQTTRLEVSSQFVEDGLFEVAKDFDAGEKGAKELVRIAQTFLLLLGALEGVVGMQIERRTVLSLPCLWEARVLCEDAVPDHRPGEEAYKGNANEQGGEGEVECEGP